MLLSINSVFSSIVAIVYVYLKVSFFYKDQGEMTIGAQNAIVSDINTGT